MNTFYVHKNPQTVAMMFYENSCPEKFKSLEHVPLLKKG